MTTDDDNRWTSFTSALGYGDDVTERAITPHELLKILRDSVNEQQEDREATVSAELKVADLIRRFDAVRTLHSEHVCDWAMTGESECFIIHGGKCARVGRCSECGAACPCPTIREINP